MTIVLYIGIYIYRVHEGRFSRGVLKRSAMRFRREGFAALRAGGFGAPPGRTMPCREPADGCGCRALRQPGEKRGRSWKKTAVERREAPRAGGPRVMRSAVSACTDDWSRRSALHLPHLSSGRKFRATPGRHLIRAGGALPSWMLSLRGGPLADAAIPVRQARCIPDRDCFASLAMTTEKK